MLIYRHPSIGSEFHSSFAFDLEISLVNTLMATPEPSLPPSNRRLFQLNRESTVYKPQPNQPNPQPIQPPPLQPTEVIHHNNNNPSQITPTMAELPTLQSRGPQT